MFHKNTCKLRGHLQTRKVGEGMFDGSVTSIKKSERRGHIE